MRLIRYNADKFDDLHFDNAKTALSHFEADKVNWLDMGIEDRAAVEAVGESCDLHHLLLEDIMASKHLPRSEDYENYFFLSLKMFNADENRVLVDEQLNIILGTNFIITFQEEVDHDVLDAVRDRILNNKGRIRYNGPDYLFYRIVDAVVSAYLETMERMRYHIEDLEDSILERSNTNITAEVLSLKKEISLIRKYTVPLRDEIGRLKNEPCRFVQPSTMTYIRDVHDELSYLVASFDNYRDMLSDLLDLQMNTLSQSMNEVMKTLTVMSSVFIPLTFLAGVYGMNFKYMPETEFWWAYPLLLAIMLVIGILLLIYMKRKRWL